MDWRQIIKDSRAELFAGDIIFTFEGLFEVISVTFSKAEVKYKLLNYKTGSTSEVTLEELKEWGYRKITCEN